jgi:glyoxylase-like metal-dependent hydrolase (beta-lactamase superfamily II)
MQKNKTPNKIISKLKKIFKYFVITMLVILVLLTAYIVCGCYFPSNIKGEKVANKLFNLKNDSLINNQGLKLHVFNTGMNKVSRLLVGKINPWRPAPAFVIEHPKFGLLVFDSGLSSEITINGEKMLHPITSFLFDARTEVGRDLPSQMKSVKLLPKNVNKVIFSHLHFDHIGNSDAFINANYYIGEEINLKKLTKMDGYEPEFMNSINKKHPFKRIKFNEAKPYTTFEKTIDLLGDGTLIAIQGNGHQTGGISLFINLLNGSILLTGDEVVHFDWLHSDDIQHLAENKNQAAKIRNQVRVLTKLMPNIIVFPGHDLPKIPTNRNDIIIHHPDWFKKEAWNID